MIRFGHDSRFAATLFVVVAFGVSTLCETFMASTGLPVTGFVGTAMADDDGGDGGDDGGAGGGGGASSGSARSGGGGGGQGVRGGQITLPFFRLFRKKARPAKRARARQAQRRASPPAAILNDRAPDEIVGLDLDDVQIARLTAGGFVVLQRETLTALGSSLTRLRIPARLSPDQARAEANAVAPQAVVDLNHLYRTNTAPASPCLDRDCPARNLIAWSLPADTAPACASRVRLGMIDTSINLDHDAFAGGRVELIRMAGSDVARSGNQHGTAIASLLVGAAGGRAPGLIPGAPLVAVDIFSRDGAGDVADAFGVTRGLDLLVSRQVEVINMSLAGPANLLLERGMAAALRSDIVVVAAAGNTGPRAEPLYPAAYASVVAVTAVDRRKRPYRRAGQGTHIDVAAPGVDVWTAASISGARLKTGTSFAAPFASAALAIWRADNPDASAEAAIKMLENNAEDLGDPGRDSVFGWGLLRPRSLCATAATSAP